MKDAQVAFYDSLPLLRDFTRLADPQRFSAIPSDWVVGVADIVDSTGQIAQGRYKTVNTVGAAVISAMINAMRGREFPYVFGGDGAGFAVPASAAEAAGEVLAAMRRWAQEEFSIPLRAALVTVAEIRTAGKDLRVARFAPSDGVDYAMFSGGGLAWAETQMKAGHFMVPEADPGVRPDLTGLSCRWSNVKAQHGQIVSLVVEPTPHATEADFADLAQSVLSAAEGLERAGHPVPENGPPIGWPPPGLSIDAHVSRAGGSVFGQMLKLLVQNLLIALLFRSGKRLGNFEPDHYKRMVSRNADYRKFDDGLKMTLDCDPATLAQIQMMLEQARGRGKVRYGLHAQDEAMMTCFVPSATRDDHVHFVDGASGGYAQAAAAMQS
ncbi:MULTISPECIES: DUF3095 domain-containing protein [unclassified Ruegeria]|uniref:DUF3095 domain-containing protein n=1 Tax=unclassified Ruegeria TaxID=2625375 RepID=UPI001ADA919B|nr:MULTISPECIES: DUF3095 domain-containing protein [unclassified Ruegeria]MBO9412135.1 DUF3095 domain-containing protein [Ruegeria sp. R8_1]MBO9417559.1 DUF3095 domain-containing protein [Ruegeria sp. R8_2]